MSGYHRLPETILASMAGDGDAAERDLLRAAHLSKRMAQLRAVLDTVDDEQARRSGVRESFAALAAVQRADPAVVAELVSGPQAGSWAALCLRVLARGVAAEPDAARTPLWAHLAHLGGIAAAAAQRAGTDVRVLVPVRSGWVHLPSAGRALVAARDDHELAELVTADGEIRVNGKAPLAWEPVRTIGAAAGGVALTVQVDDLDPYWRSFGLPITERLTDGELQDWRGQLEEAWQVLADRHTGRLMTMAAAIRCLVPVEQAERLGGVSASSADAPGAIALTAPTDAVRFAATLVHESQHYRLATLHDLRPLYEEPSSRLVYSPWRNDPRPISGVVHGLMAFAGVADFWSRERTGPPSELEYARHARQLHVALRVATGAPELTGLGAEIVRALGATVAELPLETGSPEVRRIADDLVVEHEAVWRLGNVSPSDDTVSTAVGRWAAEGTPGEVVRADAGVSTEPSGDNPLTRIAMAWLDDREKVRALADDQKLFVKQFPGASPSDLHLVAGDYDTARTQALARIANGEDDRAWSALVVVHSRACRAPERSPLVQAPEIVRAAFTRLAGGRDLAPLLALLASYEAGTSMSDSMRR